MGEAECEFEPLVLTFCCNMCSYARVDLACESERLATIMQNVTEQLREIGPDPLKPR